MADSAGTARSVREGGGLPSCKLRNYTEIPQFRRCLGHRPVAGCFFCLRKSP